MEEKESIDNSLMMNEYYNEIKHKLIKNSVTRAVKQYSINRNDLSTYYEVGRLLCEAGKHYGEGVIKEYSKKLTNELGKGYTTTRLKYYRRFYDVFSKGPTLSDKLTISHYCELIWFNDINKIKYYIKLSIDNNLTIRELREHIKSNDYERLPDKTKKKKMEYAEPTVIDSIKDPIVIKLKDEPKDVTEEKLHQLILENMEDFLNELGDDFTFKASEYRITVGNRYNYIDLLLYNIKYKCFVVVELKVTELKAEYIGQIKKYMGYIDAHRKNYDDNNTVGIIICKRNNQYVVDYCSDPMITTREYILLKM